MRLPLQSTFLSAALLTGLLSTFISRATVPVPTEVLPQPLEGSSPRNVVFILSDDHRYDAMSFMDHPIAETPHLDRLAHGGVHLENAMVSTSLCSPSRASILTGLYTFRHRVIDNNRAIPSGTLYFPQYLQQAGYDTAFFGKWHMGNEGDHPQPGFDHWVSFAGQGHYLPPYPGYTLNVNGERVPQKGYITTELTDYAIDWMQSRAGSDQPFFIYLSHKAVHANFTPEPKYEGSLAHKPYKRPASEADTPENYHLKPRWLRDQRNSWHGVDFPYHSELDIAHYYRRYCEALRSVDDSVGRVLAQLEAMDLLEDTLVIYMGDNGFMFGEHGLIDKRVAYETSIRVPMLMHCPALFAGNTVVDEVVANIDVAPTIMEAMGLAKPPHMDGLSFLPLGRGEDLAWRDAFLYVYYWEYNFPQSPTVFAIREERFKFIHYYGLWDLEELYDLANDPQEQHNLAYDPAYAATRERMRTALFAQMSTLGGMEIPLNATHGGSSDLRYGPRNGSRAADFPSPFIVETPVNTNAQ